MEMVKPQILRDRPLKNRSNRKSAVISHISPKEGEIWGTRICLPRYFKKTACFGANIFLLAQDWQFLFERLCFPSCFKKTICFGADIFLLALERQSDFHRPLLALEKTNPAYSHATQSPPEPHPNPAPDNPIRHHDCAEHQTTTPPPATQQNVPECHQSNNPRPAPTSPRRK
jgi:hypothetical protein